jgi:hypothetical protein
MIVFLIGIKEKKQEKQKEKSIDRMGKKNGSNKRKE